MVHRVIIAGASGLIGKALVAHLEQRNYEVFRFVRTKENLSYQNCIYLNPAVGSPRPEELPKLDTIINLAGENIATGRWNAEKKKLIRDSRIETTKYLVRLINEMKSRPSSLISASAIGFYGDRGYQILSEGSSRGRGFLSELCAEWESAANEAIKSGVRVINLRIGVVLSKRGGMLKEMLPFFRYNLGGKIGDGKQYISWIALEDLVDVIEFCLINKDIVGPVNAVTPFPVTNREFANLLAKKLNRFSFLSLPAFAARIIYGEMADELLLSSTRVLPQKLIDYGFKFKYENLDKALSILLEEEL